MLDADAVKHGPWGWIVAALAAAWRFALKVDEGRIYDSLEEIKGIVEGVRDDVGELKVDVAVLKDHDRRSGVDRREYPPSPREPRLTLKE